MLILGIEQEIIWQYLWEQGNWLTAWSYLIKHVFLLVKIDLLHLFLIDVVKVSYICKVNCEPFFYSRKGLFQLTIHLITQRTKKNKLQTFSWINDYKCTCELLYNSVEQ